MKSRPPVDSAAREEDKLRARGYKPVTGEDVTDLALLPKRFDLFASAVQQQLDVIGNKILPLLTEIRDEVKDLRSRVAELEKHWHTADDRFTAHHHRIAVLEKTVLVTKRPKRRRKK
ncbi:MAG TPA: hypothetical protein VIV58_31210 [Kofleriaceae bacterium]